LRSFYLSLKYRGVVGIICDMEVRGDIVMGVARGIGGGLNGGDANELCYLFQLGLVDLGWRSFDIFVGYNAGVCDWGVLMVLYYDEVLRGDMDRIGEMVKAQMNRELVRVWSSRDGNVAEGLTEVSAWRKGVEWIGVKRVCRVVDCKLVG
jgi:hypothetical protein